MMQRKTSRASGVALVLVLAFLALISVFIVGFFSSASGELNASSSYAAGISTRQLAETATNIVMGQIREGTTRIADRQRTVFPTPEMTEYMNGRVSDYDSWASQPGMIRTFRGGENASDEVTGLYKLYSSKQMTIDGLQQANNFRSASDMTTSNNDPWYRLPSLFTDINEPVYTPDPVTGDPVPRYPVLNPASFSIQNGTGDPALNRDGVEGAVLQRDPSLGSVFEDSNNERQGRMPVRWLYVLRDGSIVAPDDQTEDNGKRVRFSKTGTGNVEIVPTQENPIVGRIAFWADDDTSRININTAGGYKSETDNTGKPRYDLNEPGSFWDTPRFNTLFDRGQNDTNTGVSPATRYKGLNFSQPVAGEFQRYPGHPSTTSLGVVFQNRLSSEEIYALAPRLIGGGSTAGMEVTRPSEMVTLTAKRDRLYGSVDEMLYANDNPDRVVRTTTNGVRLGSGNPIQRKRDENNQVQGTEIMTPDLLDRTRFFLTAHSRAPELNLFGRPRITIWPIWPVFGDAGTSYKKLVYRDSAGNTPSTITNEVNWSRDQFRTLLTPQDRLLAFCSTIGRANGELGVMDDVAAKPYMFQRYDAYSARNDADIPRNRELITILKELTSTKVPGYGAHFAQRDKWGETDRNQVLAEIFDYIRSVNMRDSTHDGKPNLDQTPPAPNYGIVSRNTFKYAPRGIVVPSLHQGLPGAVGLGRFPTITEASLIFYHAGHFGYQRRHSANQSAPETADPPLVPPGNREQKMTYLYNRWEKSGYVLTGKMLGCALVFETFNPMQGYATVDTFDFTTEARSRNMFIMHKVTGLDQFRVRTESFAPSGNFFTQSLQMPAKGFNAIWRSSKDTWAGRGSGGMEGVFHTMMQAVAKDPTAAVRANDNGIVSVLPQKIYYPFQSTPIAGGGGFPFNPQLLQGDSTSADPAVRPLTIPKRQVAGGGGLGGVGGGTTTLREVQPQTGVMTRAKDQTFDFTGGTITLDIIFRGEILNSIALNFPGTIDASTGNRVSQAWPFPTDNVWFGGSTSGNYDQGGFPQDRRPNPGAGSGSAGFNAYPFEDTLAQDSPRLPQYKGQFYFPDRLEWSVQPSHDPWRNGRDSITGNNPDGRIYKRRWRQWIQPGDTVRSLVPTDIDHLSARPRTDGDPRVLALLGPNDPNKHRYFSPHPYYLDGADRRFAQSLRAATGEPYVHGDDNNNERSLESDVLQNPAAKVDPQDARLYRTRWLTDTGTLVRLPNNTRYNGFTAPDLPPGIEGAERWDGQPADFDAGTGPLPDGAYAGKADEGNFRWKYWDSNQLKYFFSYPYFTSWVYEDSYDSLFSPNRQIPSAVAFGSLLTGRKRHWETLAFCPNPAGKNHRGLSKNPKDHVLLDLFTMPVVEPYAISEPFSTAGKVNLNYPMAPFTHIHRSTALRAALQPLRVTAIPSTLATNYKAFGLTAPAGNFRYPVDRDATIAYFNSWFRDDDGRGERIFQSASRVCEMYLIPWGAPSVPVIRYSNTRRIGDLDTLMSTWWDRNTLTADNLREKPYADLYPRLTTKSNTFTVYMRVQTLKKRPFVGGGGAAAAHYAQWDEGKDQVTSEYRGYTSIERYLDPQDPRLVGTSSARNRIVEIDSDMESVERAYRFRVIESKRFQP